MIASLSSHLLLLLSVRIFAEDTYNFSFPVRLLGSTSLNEAEGAPVAILNHNVPAAYLIPAETYEWLMDKLEDSELAQIVSERAGEKENAIEVNLDEL